MKHLTFAGCALLCAFSAAAQTFSVDTPFKPGFMRAISPMRSLTPRAMQPEYPARAAREGAEGSAMIWFKVEADGKVLQTRIMHSTGNRDLDKATIEAVKRQYFRPEMLDGMLVAGEDVLQFDWRLE